MSNILRWNLNDVLRGATLAVLTVVITYVQSPTFDFKMIDWAYIGHGALNALIAYMMMKLGTSKEGNTFGMKLGRKE